MDIRKLQRAIVDGLEGVKAQNIVVFNTEAQSPLFERVIVASGNSNRQTKALAASVRDAVRASGFPVLATEGEANGEWIIVDCGAAVAHIMQPAVRDYYRLEEIWGGKAVHMKMGTAAPAKQPAARTPAVRTAAAGTVAVKKAAPKKMTVKTPAAGTSAARTAAPTSTPARKVAGRRAPSPGGGVSARKAAARPPAREAAAKPPARKAAAKAPARKAAAKPPARKTAAARPAVRKGAARKA
jgi:ribosome-associated protein